MKEWRREIRKDVEGRADGAGGVVQSLSRVRIFATPWTTGLQASQSFTISWSLLKRIESMMPSNHLILCHPLSSCLQSFPASGSFPMSRLFASGGQSIGASASASVVPMNVQGWILSEQEGTWHLCDFDYRNFAQWLLSGFPVVLKCNHVCSTVLCGNKMKWAQISSREGSLSSAVRDQSLRVDT